MVNFCTLKPKNEFKLLISFTIFLLIANEINSFELFKAFDFNSDLLLLITDDGLMTTKIGSYSNKSLHIKSPYSKKDFNLDYVSVSTIPEEKEVDILFVRIRDTFYAMKSNSASNIVINSLFNTKADIIAYKSNNEKINLVFSQINSTSSDLFLLMVHYDPIKNSFPFGFVFLDKIKKSDGSYVKFVPDLITCSLLQSKRMVDSLTCLTLNSESYLGLVTFEITDSFTVVDYQIVDKGRNIISLSSIAKESKDEALFCFIDKTKYLKCFKYYSKTGKISRIDKYLKNCIYYQNNKGIRYVMEKEEYLLYCYQENEYNLAYTKLDRNFNKKDSIGYHLYTIDGCDSIYSSSLIFNRITNNYSLAINCLYDNEPIFKITNIEDSPIYVNYFSTIYDLNYISIISGDDIIKGTIDKTKEDIDNFLYDIIDAIEIGKKYEFNGDNYNIYISPLEENSSYDDFSKCEQLLKQKYNLFDEEILTLLEIEMNSKATIQIEYEIFDEEKNILDLSYCNDEPTSVLN